MPGTSHSYPIGPHRDAREGTTISVYAPRPFHLASPGCARADTWRCHLCPTAEAAASSGLLFTPPCKLICDFSSSPARLVFVSPDTFFSGIDSVAPGCLPACLQATRPPLLGYCYSRPWGRAEPSQPPELFLGRAVEHPTHPCEVSTLVISYFTWSGLRYCSAQNQLSLLRLMETALENCLLCFLMRGFHPLVTLRMWVRTAEAELANIEQPWRATVPFVQAVGRAA